VLLLILLVLSCGRPSVRQRGRKPKEPPPIIDVGERAPGARISRASDDLHQRVTVEGIAPVLVPQIGHAAGISAVAFSPDGRLLATGSADATIKIWDVETGAELWTLDEHRSGVSDLAFSQDGALLASADSTAIVWDARTWNQVAALPGRGSEEGQRLVKGANPEGIAFSPDAALLAVGYLHGDFILWDVSNGTAVHHWKRAPETDIGSDVCFSPDGRLIGAVRNAHSLDAERYHQYIQLWEADTGSEAQRIRLETYSLSLRCLFSPDGSLLTAGRSIYEVHSGREAVRLGARVRDILDFSPDGSLVLCSLGEPYPSRRSWLEVWDTRAGTSVRALQGEPRAGDIGAFSPDGKLVAARTGDALVIWDAATGQQLWRATPRVTGVRSVSRSPAETHIALITVDIPLLTVKGRGVLWELRDGSLRPLALADDGLIGATAFSPDGRLLAIGRNETVELLDVQTRQTLARLAGHTRDVTSLAFSPDGGTLVSGSADTTARLWDVATGEQTGLWPTDQEPLADASVGRLDGERQWVVRHASMGQADRWHTRYVTRRAYIPEVWAVAFSPDGQTVAASARNLDLWDVQTGRRLRTLDAEHFRARGLAFSPRGDVLALGTHRGLLKVWSLPSGEQLAELAAGHGGEVTSLAFSADGDLLASASEDNTIQLWNVPSLTEKRALTGHTCQVNSVAFGRRNGMLLSGSFDGTVRLWDPATGENRLTVYTLDEGREWLATTPDGYFDCSPGAEDVLAWRVGDEVYLSSEWDEQLRRPRLVASVLGPG
jgi:WD40 repeat protein